MNYEPKTMPGAEKKDTVIDQSVDANNKLDVSEKIIIYVSDGTLAAKVTKQVEIALPTLDDFAEQNWLPADYTEGAMVTYGLTVKQGSQKHYEVADVELGKNATVSVELTGTGIQVFEVYINGNAWKEIRVDFTEA